MTPILATLLAVPFAICGTAFFYARLVSTPSQSIAEALVRWLYLAARWTQAVAQAADSAVIAYREHLGTTQVEPHCERRLTEAV